MDSQTAELLEQMRQGLDRMDQARALAQRHAAGYAGLAERLSQVGAAVTSPDGGVTVVSGPGASVREVRLTEAALRLGSARLSQVVTATIAQAVVAAARQQAGVVSDVIGDNSVLADRLAKTMEQNQPAPPVAPPARQAHVDDDAHGSVLTGSDW